MAIFISEGIPTYSRYIPNDWGGGTVYLPGKGGGAALLTFARGEGECFDHAPLAQRPDGDWEASAWDGNWGPGDNATTVVVADAAIKILLATTQWWREQRQRVDTARLRQAKNKAAAAGDLAAKKIGFAEFKRIVRENS